MGEKKGGVTGRKGITQEDGREQGMASGFLAELLSLASESVGRLGNKIIFLKRFEPWWSLL